MIPAPAVDRAVRMRLDGYSWDGIKQALEASGYGEFSEKDIKDAIYTRYHPEWRWERSLWGSQKDTPK
jgi:hypothetical protein